MCSRKHDGQYGSSSEAINHNQGADVRNASLSGFALLLRHAFLLDLPVLHFHHRRAEGLEAAVVLVAGALVLCWQQLYQKIFPYSRCINKFVKKIIKKLLKTFIIVHPFGR